mgnify:CR=1 FL=1
MANLIAHRGNRPFHLLSAINSGVKDVREVIDKARRQAFFDTPSPILFIDEIHRFNKAQQDALLGAVERGTIVLIGATTENPSFEVSSALLSRCQVYILKSLTREHLEEVIDRALRIDPYLSGRKILLEDTEELIRYSGGDARKLLNQLEIIISGMDDQASELIITNELVHETLQNNPLRYHKGGEQHYDMISAFIKTMRGSDPQATVYWMARMLEGGEDVQFIARRMIILAAEDIGLANPNALLLANSCFQSVHVIGMPEARIILSEIAIYLASSPKSNSSYVAIKNAYSTVKESGNLSIPLHLRNAPTKLMKEIGYGKNYQYAHDHEGNFVNLDYLPEEINGHVFYNPSENPNEQKVKKRLKYIWKDRYDI